MANHKAGLTLWQKIQVELISWIGWALVWLFNSTLRYSEADRQYLESARRGGRPVIYSFWHNQIFMATYFFRFQRIVVITSRHFDGEYIARIIERFGYGAARGSSTKGAVRALLQLKKRLSHGHDVAFTIDGPRGPLYKVKSGPLWLSRRSGAAIVPFHIEPERFWALKSWDRFRIPRPFCRAVVQYGEPILVYGDEQDEAWMPRYQAEMERIQGSCRQRVSAPKRD